MTDLRGTSIGYAINIKMKLGDNRDVDITGCLPTDATLADFNKELDKLRLATNRQQAFIILRDREIMLEAEEKSVLAIKKLMEEYEATFEEEMKRVQEQPLHSSGKQRTQITAQIENIRTQVVNFKSQKQIELNTHQANVDNCKVIIAKMKKEIGGENDNESP